MIKKIALAIVALILCLMAAVFLFAKDIEIMGLKVGHYSLASFTV